MFGHDQVAAAEQGGAFHGVAQFADVARPGVVFQAIGHGGGKARAALGESGDELAGQRQDVLAPLAQRRDVQFHHVEAVEQVFAETAGFDFLLEVAVGGGEDAGVDVDFGVGADALEAAVLGHAQQFGLKLRRHLGDFIQKNRAAVGHFEAADALGDARR